MGRKSSSSSILSMLKSLLSCCGNGRDDWSEDGGVNVRSRIMASDEDGRRWIAEPGIDRRASAFIARFYETRVTDSDYQTLPP